MHPVIRSAVHWCVAIALCPVILAARTVTLVPADPRVSLTDCEAHVAKRFTAAETVKRCGEEFELGEDDLVGWLEKKGQISPIVPLTRAGKYAIGPFVPAGRISLSNELELTEGEQVELISLASWNPAAGGGEHFERVIARDGARREYQVPAGKVIAVHFDRKRHVLAISEAVEVAANGRSAILPRPPKEGSDFLAVFERPRRAARVDDDQVGVAIATVDGTRKPGVLASVADVVIAAWYGLPAGRHQIEIDSSTLRLAERELHTTRRSAALLRQPLALLPSLAVSIGPVPEGTTVEPMTLTILGAVDERVIGRQQVRPGNAYRFDHLPAAVLTASLDIGSWKMDTKADLSSGADSSLTIPLTPINVTGVVYLGDTPTRAEVRFLQPGKPVVFKTDERGRYNATLWRAARYFVDTTISDQPSRPPFRSFVSITAPQTLDIHIPAARLQARVRDADKGEPVTGTIALRSIYTGARGRESDVLAIKTGDGELTELPPVRPGTLELRVTAPGYHDSDLIKLPIDEAQQSRIIEVPMRRVGETIRLEIRFADGRPASGAEVALWRGGADVAAHQSADARGVVEVPASMVGSMLLVRHPSAGSSVFPLEASRSILQLPLAAPPLALQVRDGASPGGRMPARITAWFNNKPVSGPALAFLTWAPSDAPRGGTWIARNLPAQRLKVVAVNAAGPTAVHEATLEAMAEVIPFPWPDSPTLMLK